MNVAAKRIIDTKLNSLSKSTFRTSFKLKKKEVDYITKTGLNKIREHCIDFVNQKLGDAYPLNDGSQTPTKNHPVFIAQHATACCCRGCLEKWHGICKGRELTQNEKNFIVELIMEWIKREYKEKLV